MAVVLVISLEVVMTEEGVAVHHAPGRNRTSLFVNPMEVAGQVWHGTAAPVPVPNL